MRSEGAHRCWGARLTLTSTCFCIWSLITIDRNVELTCWRRCIIAIDSVLGWLPGDFSNEAKLLNRSSMTPRCNRSPPYLIPCCSIQSTQGTLAKPVLHSRYAGRTVVPQVNTRVDHPMPLVWSCRKTTKNSDFPSSQTTWNRGKWGGCVSQAFPTGMQSSNDFCCSVVQSKATE